MNKRLKKKKLKMVIENIQCLNLKQDEFLIIKYDMNKFRVDQIDMFNKYIKETVSKKVLLVPKEFDLIKVKETLESSMK